MPVIFQPQLRQVCSMPTSGRLSTEPSFGQSGSAFDNCIYRFLDFYLPLEVGFLSAPDRFCRLMFGRWTNSGDESFRIKLKDYDEL